MFNIAELTTFLGWCSLINIVILFLSSILIVTLKQPIAKLHSKLMGVKSSDLLILYFQYLAHYKIYIIIFNIVPYIALQLMS